MLLIAAQGGASRAGYWTGEVLAQLDAQTGGDIRPHIFAINAVSGGGVGATGYVSLLEDARAKGARDHLNRLCAKTPTEQRIAACQADDKELRARLQTITGRDALGPTMAVTMFSDLLYRFVPLPWFPDRAAALEGAWEAAWREACHGMACYDRDLFAKPFLDLGADAPDGTSATDDWVPHLIIQGVHQESGDRILTSRLDFQEGDAVNAKDFFEHMPRDIFVSTAIHNGARFPYVSPAGMMLDGTEQKRVTGHIVDGGYFDGSGVETLREVGEAILASRKPVRPDRIVFVLIGYEAVTTAEDEDDGKPIDEARLNELFAPLEAGWNARAGLGRQMMLNLAEFVSPTISKCPSVEMASTEAGEDGAKSGSQEASEEGQSYPPHYQIRCGNIPDYAELHYVPIILCDPQAESKWRKHRVHMSWVVSNNVKSYVRSFTRDTGGGDAGAWSAPHECKKRAGEAIEYIVDLLRPPR